MYEHCQYMQSQINRLLPLVLQVDSEPYECNTESMGSESIGNSEGSYGFIQF